MHPRPLPALRVALAPAPLGVAPHAEAAGPPNPPPPPALMTASGRRRAREARPAGSRSLVTAKGRRAREQGVLPALVPRGFAGFWKVRGMEWEEGQELVSPLSTLSRYLALIRSVGLEASSRHSPSARNQPDSASCTARERECMSRLCGCSSE
eukprot:2403210-Pyramimonas_sp.AAC.1